MSCRSDGIDKLFALTDDICWIQNEVKGLNFLWRHFFHKQYKIESRKIKDVYTAMSIECQHQILNNAYEQMIDFRKQPTIKKYFNNNQ